MSVSTAVLVTGCSSGIGRATALALARAGFPTWASARRVDTLGPLAEAGCRTVRLDVTDEESCVAAVAAVEAEHGAVGALVNNAGYSQGGPVEEVPVDDYRRQFETNVFGVVRLCQLVLRARRSGTIVNLSSGAGLVTVPGTGPYSMTKYAVESLSDALRFEVRPFGVRVVLVEPQAVRTELVANGAIAGGTGPYETFKRNLDDLAGRAFREGARGVLSPDDVAAVVTRAVSARRPKPRYKVGLQVRLLPKLRGVLPDRAWDRLLARQLPVD